MTRADFDMQVEFVTEAYRRYVEEQQRRYRWAWSGPNKAERQIGHAYRIKPKLLGIGAPPLAIDGRAYRRRQKNRVKRRRR
jgi:predicted methyltransferase